MFPLIEDTYTHMLTKIRIVRERARSYMVKAHTSNLLRVYNILRKCFY